MRRATIDRSKLRKLHAAGNSVNEIANALGCSLYSVKGISRKLDLKYQSVVVDLVPEAALRASVADGLTREEASIKFGVSVSTIGARAKKYDIKFPQVQHVFEATKPELKKQIDLGLSVREMAALYGFSQNAIRVRLRLYKLRCKKLGPRKARSNTSRLSREIAETFINQGMSPEEIAEKVDLDLDYVRKLLREYDLIGFIMPARAVGAIKSAPPLPKVINSVERVNTPAEHMAEKIFKHEMRVLSRGYSDATRGLNPAGDVVIRARAKCGARAVFVVGESVPKACGKTCSCKGRHNWRITKK